MGYLLESTIGEVLCTLLLLFWILYTYVTYKYNYWRDRGIPYNKPHFPFGSVASLFFRRKHIGEAFDDFYKEFRDEPFFGVFEGRRATLVVKDPDLLKLILIKDFHHFHDRALIPINKKTDYISNHLFNMQGEDWKRMRLKLTPTFTSGKMKLMFLLMTKCGEQLQDCVEKKVNENPEVDVKDVLVRFTMDIIATCAFGLEVNSLLDDDCEFLRMGKRIFRTSGVTTLILRVMTSLLPFLTKIYMPRFTPPEVSDFLTKIVKDTVKYREENNVNRNDFLDLLIKIRQDKNIQEGEDQLNGQSLSMGKDPTQKTGFTIEEITAQAFVFFAAGFETASSTTTFCLYELARNPDVQDRLYQEIKQVLMKHDGLTYQAVQEMSYMDQVINETLRMYASVAVLHRSCTKAYKVPNSDLVLEEGQRVIIPAFAIHHDPQYYPDPYRFDPERFTPEQVKARHSCVFLPFGEGPRMCIGMRFGLLQTKVGLAELVSKYEFGLVSENQAITLSKASFVTQSEKPILLHLTRRE